MHDDDWIDDALGHNPRDTDDLITHMRCDGHEHSVLLLLHHDSLNKVARGEEANARLEDDGGTLVSGLQSPAGTATFHHLRDVRDGWTLWQGTQRRPCPGPLVRSLTDALRNALDLR